MKNVLLTALCVSVWSTAAVADNITFRCKANPGQTCNFSVLRGNGAANFTLQPGNTQVMTGLNIGEVFYVSDLPVYASDQSCQQNRHDGHWCFKKNIWNGENY